MAKSAKPWYRFRNIALLIVAAVGGLLGWAAYVAVTARPGNAVDYQRKLVELVESHQPGAPGDANAWEPFAEAVSLIEQAQAEMVAAAGGEDAQPADWPNFGWPYDFSSLKGNGAPAIVVEPTVRMMAMLRERGVHERLAAMAATPRAVRPGRPRDEWVVGLLIPELGPARDLARWCAARMHEAARTGDTGEFVDSFEQTLAIGRVVGSQWTLIHRLTGLAIVALATGELRRELAAGTLDAAACRQILDAIDRQLPLPPMELTLQGERLGALDSIQRTHTDDGRGSGRLVITALDDLENLGSSDGPTPKLYTSSIVNVVGLLMPSKAESVARVNEYYEQMIALSNTIPAERPADAFNGDAYIEALPRGYIVLRLLLPAISPSITANDRHGVEVAGLRIMLALEVHRHEKGAYPARLEDLVPSILAELPIDPFSGRPFGYKLLTDEGAAEGWLYTLYSVGADGVDDAGTPHAEGPHGALGPEAQGSDFIVNEPLPAGR